MTTLSSPAPPLDDDDLLSEILLRLPPQPSSLPRASLVCNRWRCLVSDPGFTRRFRLHHRRNPPLLGLFFQSFHEIHFLPTPDPPNRVPHDHFRLHFDEGDHRFMILGCRHGLALALIYHASRNQLLVWDPVNGDRHRLDIPPGFEMKATDIHGAVLRAAGDACHFQVVLVGNDEKQYTRVLACTYSSETGAWGNLISTLLPPKPKDCMRTTRICMSIPSVLVGDSLYWILTESSAGILEFDLGRQSLAVIPVPVDVFAKGSTHFRVMRAEDGGLGCLFLSGFSAQFWKRRTDCGGVASSWVLGRTIEMDKVLPMNLEEEKGPLKMMGFAEDNNVAVVWTIDGLFMVQVESLQFKKISETKIIFCYHSFESVYTGETSIGGGNEGAELLLSE